MHILLLAEDSGWTAQMLEMDFAAHGHSEREALICLARTIQGHARMDEAHGRQLFQGVEAAPAEFWDMWRSALAEHEVPTGTPEPHVIQATLDRASLSWQ